MYEVILMILLDNGILTVKINELGAEIKSVIYEGTERFWTGRPEVWKDSSILLFPVCGGLKDNKYTYDGKEYNMPKHGYGRNTLFEVESCNDTEVVFLHKSTPETLTIFPFEYELRIKYVLENNSIKVSYIVDNKTDRTMYFSIGSHEGYYTPDGIENYDIVFPEKETLNRHCLYGNVVSQMSITVLKNGNVLPLYEKYFDIDAMVFRSIKSKSAVLRNRRTGRCVKVDFPFATAFLLWHKPNAPYICLEPWAGLDDIEGAGSDITKKEGIIPLESKKTYVGEHTITFYDED